jgi:hypothetical protein
VPKEAISDRERQEGELARSLRFLREEIGLGVKG